MALRPSRAPRPSSRSVGRPPPGLVRLRRERADRPRRHVPARVFASSRGQPAFGRATDVFLLVPSLIGLALLIAVYPPSRFERSLIRFLATFPQWLDPL